jgi:hypothetical protein
MNIKTILYVAAGVLLGFAGKAAYDSSKGVATAGFLS